jgi:hypothetical protein
MGKRMLYAPRESLLAEGLPVMQTLNNLCISAVHMVLNFFWNLNTSLLSRKFAAASCQSSNSC